MVKQGILCGGLSLISLKDSEAPNHIMAALVRFVADALIPMRQLLEEAYRHLEGHVVGAEEDTSDERVAHPPLAHDSVGGLHFALDGHPLVGSQGADAEAPHLLDLLDAHHLVHLLSVLVVVAVADLDALDSVFSRLVPERVNVTQLAVVLQFLIHLM